MKNCLLAHITFVFDESQPLSQIVLKETVTLRQKIEVRA